MGTTCNNEQLLFDALLDASRGTRNAFANGDVRQALILLQGVYRDAAEAQRTLLSKISPAELAYYRNFEAALARRTQDVKGTA